MKKKKNEINTFIYMRKVGIYSWKSSQNLPIADGTK